MDTNDDNHVHTMSRIGVNIDVDDDEQWNILGINIHMLIHTLHSYIQMLIHIYIFQDDDGWDDDIENDLSLFKLIMDYIMIGIYA